MKRGILAIGLAGTVFLALTAQIWGQTVEIGTPMPSGKVMPIIVAEKSGMFKKYGIKIGINYFSSGTMTTTALVAGTVAISCSGGTDAIYATIGGADLVTIAGIFDHVDGQLVVSKDITKPEQLRGKAVAISRFGANSEFKARLALKAVNLDYSKDVTLMQVGGTSQRLAALKAGSVHGAIIDPPANLIAKKMGMNVLVDILDQKIPGQLIVIAVKRSYANENAETVEKFLKGLIAGIHYMRTHKDETIQMMKKAMGVDDMEALEETYQAVLYKGVPVKPYPSAEGLQIFVDFVGERNPKAKGVKSGSLVESKFVEKLDKAGFIDGLYKN